jgi:hypothetical protein
MAREFVYQYNGKASLRDEPELVGDEIPIPAPDTFLTRRGTKYKVRSVSVTNARKTFPRYIIDLRTADFS